MLCYAAARHRIAALNADIAIGALCGIGLLDSLNDSLSRFANWNFVNTRDAVDIDLQLAHAISSLLPVDTTAAAASIHLWDGGCISGGVIGAPHAKPLSAIGSLEEIASGVWCWSVSSGPGFVVSCARENALHLANAVYAAKDSNGSWRAFQSQLGAHHMGEYLYVTDGCGAQGMLAAGGGNGAFITRLGNGNDF